MKARSVLQFARFVLGAILPCLLALGTSTPAHAGGMCFVDATATGGDNGNTWQDAYTDLQSAFEALSCNEVWVAAGIYKPTAGTDRAISFVLRNSLAIYGGFAGTETDLSQRNPAVNVTILSGEIGDPDATSDNSYHVVVSSGTDGSARLDGFTVTAGYASGEADQDQYGGGIYISAGSPTLANLIFIENRALYYGGGMYNSAGSTPGLTNVTFSNNIAEDEYGGGGGMFNDASSPSLTGVLFSDNWARYGGGMRNIQGSDPTLLRVTFNRNHAHGGGGMHNNASSPSLTNVAFFDNTGGGGGGMNNENVSSPSLMNVIFSGNRSGEWGGGMINYYHSDTTLVNVTFNNNSALESGGAIYNSNSNLILTNVTFHSNSVDSWGTGGGMHNYSSSLTLTNVTFRGNSADDQLGGAIYNRGQTNLILINSILYGDPGGEIVNDASSAVVTYSIVQGGYPGTGNLDADPLLGPLQNNGGFTLTMALASGSPAIDAGSDSVCPPKDQRGIVRPQGAHCDMGAFEYSAPAIRTRRLLSIAAQDGWVLESTEDSAVGGSKNAAAQTFRLGDDASDRQYRTFLSFDTSALPDDAVITGAGLRIRRQGLTGTDPFMTHGWLQADIRKGAFSNNAALERIDFSASASRGAVASFGRLPSNGWYTATLGSGALAYINKAGITQFRLRFSLDDNDDHGADFMQFYSGDAASNKPVLILTYYLP